MTREPEPRATEEAGRSFVVQKHAARRLHYDFRLELDGVLKSWAVPKGPSLRVGDKRLAVEVEDHPVEYAHFEGSIPRGQYGGGEVIVWDRGKWSPIGDPHEGLSKGRLRFSLDGERLHGQWALVRMNGRRSAGRSERPAWLLMKSADDFAEHDREDLTSRETTSVVTSRTIEDLAESKGSSKRGRAPMPSSVEPELATLVDEPPREPGWWFELKVDGYRAIAFVDGGNVRLVSRNGLDWTERYRHIARALGRLHANTAVLDGEICFLGEDGTTSFQKLQQALRNGDESKIAFVVFDLLHCDGRDLRGLPLSERKRLLEGIFAGEKLPLFLSAHVDGNGERLFREACKRGREGIIGKRSDAPYVSGRSRAWVKVKCARRDEFVIVGFTPPKGKRSGIGALVLATKATESKASPLRFAGKVGTGFAAETLRDLERRLRPLVRASAPIAVPRGVSGVRGAIWVEPSLVCDVEFTERTEDERLRHPVYVGLREDKAADEVIRERATRRRAVERGARRAEPRATRPRRPSSAARSARSNATSVPNGRTSPSAAPSVRSEPVQSVHGVSISHGDRVVDAASGTTKGDVAAYYGFVAERILTHARRRPLALVRCPTGVGGECFFQRHAPEKLPDVVRRDRIGKHDVLDVDSPAGLIALVQFGVLELHGWGSRLPDWRRPDHIVFDLDPDEGLAFQKTVLAARELHAVLEHLGLTAFVKTTGGKGLHVVVPIVAEAPFSDVAALARDIAEALVEADPDTYVATPSKRERRGKIFVDYLRNGEAASAVLPFSARARPGLPVAMPIGWDELDDVDPADFTVATVPPLLAENRPNPWRDFPEAKRRLPDLPDRGELARSIRRRKPAAPRSAEGRR